MAIQQDSSVTQVANAITALFHPHVEVVVHDLSTGLIAGVWNPTSGRSVGDDSLIEREFRTATEGDVLGPYEQTDIRGHRTTSVSVLVANDQLLCINFDRSVLDGAILALTALAAPRTQQPDQLFTGDWRARINEAIAAWCAKHHHVARDLTRSVRQELVVHLEAQSLFETKNAVEHVAAALGVSRATVYNLRKEAQQ